MGPPRRSRHQSRYRARLEFGLIAAATIFATFWLGLVPPRFSPFAPVNLSEPDSWFLDFRLAALKRDAHQCHAALASPLIDATPIPDAAFEKGCGWRNAVRFSHAGGAHLGVDKISCAAGKLTIVPLTKLAATTRKRNTVKTGSFTCMVAPGVGECKGKAGAAVGFASALYGAP